MYTNGLKDRFGSPLISKRDGDNRYAHKSEIQYRNSQIEEKIESLEKNISHSSDNIKEINDKVYANTIVLNSHSNDIDIHFGEGEKKDFHNVVSVIKNNKNVFDENITEYTEYDNNIFPFAIEGGDNTYTSSVRYDYKHLPKGVITSVSFLARDSSTGVHDSKTNGCYLLANVYKKDGTLVRSHGSINKVVVVEKQSSDAERPLNTWLFDGIPSIEEDEIIKFIPSPNGVSQKSNYYFGIRVDTTHTHDDCQEGGDWDFVNNPLGVGNKCLAFAKFGGDFYYRNSKSKELKPYEKTFLQSLYTKTSVKLFDNNVNNENLGVGSVKGWILERPYITNGIFNEIRWTSVGTVSWTENGQPKSTTRIAITLRDKYGKNIKTLFSNNEENFSAQGLKSFRFNEEFEIDDNIGSILIQTSTDGSTISTVAQLRVRVIGNAAKPNADGSETTNNNFIIHCEFWGNNVSLGGDILTTTQANSTFATKEELGGYVANETLGDYVTNDNLETNYYNKEESADVFVTNEEFDELVKDTQLYYYDTWTNVKNQDSLEPASIKAFQYSKSDFVASRFDRIEFPFQAVGNTGYLCVQFFNSNSQVIENATYFSNNKFAQVGASDRLRKLTTFTFDEIYPPEDYAFVRFSFVPEKVAPATIANGMSIKAMYINRSGASWGSYTYLYNDSAARQNLTIYITVLSRKGTKNTGITYREYDWTPDFFNGVTVTMSAGGKAFVAPTNGWLISNAHKTTTAGNTITINSIEFGYSSTTAQAPVQMLLRKGDVVTSSHSYTVDFYPCKSEQHDYIPVNEHTPYDIWKGAVVYDANGEVSVRDLYVPNASAWKSEVGHAVTGSITRIEDEQAFDSNGNVLFNIQSQYITNGTGMFVQSTISSFEADLNALTNGTQMFGYSGLTQWNTNLPKLVTGDCMFMACGSLTSFTADLHSLSSGWYFFTNCSNLTDVTIVGNLDALTDGTAMFKNCSLNYTSLNNILNALPARNGNVIEITVADNVKNDMLNDPQWEGVSIPAHNSVNYYEFNHNGWKVRLTSRTGFTLVEEVVDPDDVITEKDLSEANGNLNYTTSWNEQFGRNSGITKVINEVAYN